MLETVKIFNEDQTDYIVINEADYDPSTQKLYVEPDSTPRPSKGTK
jgi:hypothetical protein